MMGTVEAEATANDLASGLPGLTFGQTRVEDADVEVGLDADDEWAVFLTIRLSDPNGATWPYGDVLALRRDVRSRAERAGVIIPLYVRLVPTTDPPQEEEGDPRLFGT